MNSVKLLGRLGRDPETRNTNSGWVERFLAKVEVDRATGCWNWAGAKQSNGYGRFNLNRRSSYTHRVAYALFHGEPQLGMDVCHKCDNRLCVNPEHLFLGSRLDNMQDAREKRRLSLGGNRYNARLHERDIPHIREMLSAGVSHTAIAEEFGVARTTIAAISTGRTWWHVQDGRGNA